MEMAGSGVDLAVHTFEGMEEALALQVVEVSERMAEELPAAFTPPTAAASLLSALIPPTGRQPKQSPPSMVGIR